MRGRNAACAIASEDGGLSRKWRHGGRRPAASPGGRRCSVRSRSVPPKSSSVVVARAHAMRHCPTASEAALWRQLSGRRLDGIAFKRQVPIGPYIADFLAPRQRLIVEVDGAHHAQRVTADARRERWLGRWGYKVLRLEAELVLRGAPEVLRRVREALG